MKTKRNKRVYDKMDLALIAFELGAAKFAEEWEKFPYSGGIAARQDYIYYLAECFYDAVREVAKKKRIAIKNLWEEHVWDSAVIQFCGWVVTYLNNHYKLPDERAIIDAAKRYITIN